MIYMLVIFFSIGIAIGLVGSALLLRKRVQDDYKPGEQAEDEE
jgi:hypothetical protein